MEIIKNVLWEQVRLVEWADMADMFIVPYTTKFYGYNL